MVRPFIVTVLFAGLAFSGCGGASNAVSEPRLPAIGADTLSDVLYSFHGDPDGKYPLGGLLAGKNGEFYGTSVEGGSENGGAVYEIDASGREKVIYSLPPHPHGEAERYPFVADKVSTLIMDDAGALYGTTSFGGDPTCGPYGCGYVFKLTPGKHRWTESVLYTFPGGGNNGAFPYGGLLLTKSGALFGTTYFGGISQNQCGGSGCGTVFELKPSASGYREKVIYNMGGPPDGYGPTDSLVADSSGNLYGTTAMGGNTGAPDGRCPGPFHHRSTNRSCGTVFKLTRAGSKYTHSVIYRFKGGMDGKFPRAGLLIGPNGVLYGLTTEGGSRAVIGYGMVFKLTPSGSTYTESAVYRFKGGSDGSNPNDAPGLIADASGNLYGTTLFGGGSPMCTASHPNGMGCGTVFKLTRSGKRFTESALYAFQGGSDGANPYGSVVIDAAGNLLGPTYNGGQYGEGTIFSVAP